MAPSMKIAVAGATGRVGRHLVDVLEAQGHDVVAMSRSTGVDLVTGRGLSEALAGVDSVIDAASQPSPDEKAATEFFIASARNLQDAGERAGVQGIVVVSIIGCDRFAAGYNVAKVAQEQALESGPIPVRVLRAAQFHEFVPQLVDWGRQGEVSQVPKMRTQLVAARTWPPIPTRFRDPTRLRSRRSPVQGSRASSRWRRCSRPGAATPPASRASVTPPTPTASCSRRMGCCPAPMPPSPDRPSRSGSSPRPRP
jgi:uncharacterized protein YbjT (DUF2867 family)